MFVSDLNKIKSDLHSLLSGIILLEDPAVLNLGQNLSHITSRTGQQFNNNQRKNLYFKPKYVKLSPPASQVYQDHHLQEDVQLSSPASQVYPGTGGCSAISPSQSVVSRSPGTWGCSAISHSQPGVSRDRRMLSYSPQPAKCIQILPPLTQFNTLLGSNLWLTSGW